MRKRQIGFRYFFNDIVKLFFNILGKLLVKGFLNFSLQHEEQSEKESLFLQSQLFFEAFFFNFPNLFEKNVNRRMVT